jgi:hypothetical protein
MKISRIRLIACVPLIFGLSAASAQAEGGRYRGPDQCQRTYQLCLQQERTLNAELKNAENELREANAALARCQRSDDHRGDRENHRGDDERCVRAAQEAIEKYTSSIRRLKQQLAELKCTPCPPPVSPH